MAKARRSSSAIRAIRIGRKVRRMYRAAAAGPRRTAMRKLFRTIKGRVIRPRKLKATGSKAQVWKGRALHTSGGLTKNDILRLSIVRGGKRVHRYVSKRKHALGKARKGPASHALLVWRRALKVVTGGVVPRKGTDAYRKAKALYAQLLNRRSAGLSVKKSRSAGRRVRSAPSNMRRTRRGPRGTRKARK